MPMTPEIEAALVELLEALADGVTRDAADLESKAEEAASIAEDAKVQARGLGDKLATIHGQVDGLRALLAGEEPPPLPPDPPPPGEGPSPETITRWEYVSPAEAAEQTWALPEPVRGPGLLVAVFSGEVPGGQTLGIEAIDGGWFGGNQCVNNGNSLRPFCRQLSDGEEVDHLLLRLDRPESVIGAVLWFPGLEASSDVIMGHVPGGAVNTDRIALKLAGLPAGALVVTAAADNSNAPDVWHCQDAAEVQDTATTLSGGHGQAVAYRLGVPAGDWTCDWHRSASMSRLLAVAVAFDVRGEVVPPIGPPPVDPPSPPPPPPPPPPPSGDGLEKVDSSAEQIGLRTGGDRATVIRYGAGLGSPGGQSKADDVKRCVAAAGGLITEFRLNTGDPSYAPSCKAEGVVGFHMTHYGWQPGNATSSAKSAVDQIMRLWDAGVKVSSVCGQNEPRCADYSDDQLRAMPIALRAELDKRTLGAVKDVTFEFANCDGVSARGPAIWAPQVPMFAQCMGHHSYGYAVSEWFFGPWLGKGGWGRQYECGYLSWSSALARALNDGRCDEVWCAHRLHQTDANSDPSQNLFANDCKPYPWTLGLFAIWRAFPPGTRMLDTIRTGVSGDAASMHYLKSYHSPVYARVGRLASGGYAVAAFNYSGGKKQITVDVPGAKAGGWLGQRLVSSGKATPFGVDGIKDAVRCTVGPGELVTLKGGGI